MSGFIRRYGFFPATEVVTQIEGVIIIDLPQPAAIQGVGTGTVCMIGEFADASYALKVESTGQVVPNPNPVEVFSSQDLLDKGGGFDETLGNFGGEMGNGFVELRNKRFSRLVLAPVDNITVQATRIQGSIRLFRDLPTNKSATDATPIVPVSPASIPAGTEFLSSANRIRTASPVQFADLIHNYNGVDGDVTAVAAAVTQIFTSASGDFVNRGIAAGDILVMGVIGGAGALGANARTYRVVSRTNATTLVVEKMDGTSFAWTTGSAQPWRLYKTGVNADSKTGAFSTAGAYNVLGRPLTATVAAGSVITPLVAVSAGTATTWDPKSGLGGAVHPTIALTYDATIHAPNVSASSNMDTRYLAAIDALLNDAYPTRDINIVVSARKTNSIRAAIRQHVALASERGLTRRGIISPAVNQLTLTTVVGDSAPGVGALRTDRLDYAWPGAQTNIPEASGFTIPTSDGLTTTDGILDVTGDTWLASVESNLAPERNPGQAAEPVPTVMAPVVGFARGTPRLAMPEYVALRSAGVVGLRFDRVSGPIFQSGVTTSLESGRKNIFRRRMADFIQDSLADALNPFSKLPASESRNDSVITEIIAFLDELKSPDAPEASRITDYSVDTISGNTPARRALGIFVIIVRVKLTPTDDFIVLQTDIGESVEVSVAA
jgi:hypothetical protein